MAVSIRQKLTDAINDRAESLAFGDSFMGDEGCRLVAEHLKNNSDIKSLDLRGCNIRGEGAQLLGSLLSANSSLTFLGLEWNGVGMMESGIQALCKALAANRTLTEIDLRNNNIGPVGGAAIAAMLNSNRSLKRMDLRWNSLGVNGGKAVASALEGNRVLIELEIAGNKATDETMKLVDRFIQRNRNGGSLPSSASASPAKAVHLAASSHVQGTSLEVEAAQSHFQGSTRGTGSQAARPSEEVAPEVLSRTQRLENLRSQGIEASMGRGAEAMRVQEAEVPRAKGLDSSLGMGQMAEASMGRGAADALTHKLTELSQALVECRERNATLERNLTEEQRYRGELEQQLKESEKLISEQQQMAQMSSSEAIGKMSNLQKELGLEKELRLKAETRCSELQKEVDALHKDKQDALQKTVEQLQGNASEAQGLRVEYQALLKAMQEAEVSSAEEKTQLIEKLRKAEEFRGESEHKIRLSHQDKLREKEAEFIAMQGEQKQRIKNLEDQYQTSERARLKAEEDHRSAQKMLQELKVDFEKQVVQLQDKSRREEEGRILLLDEKITSIQQARELQQARADQLAFEIQEMRMQENVRLKEHDKFIHQEAEARMEAEKKAEEKQNSLEKASIELMQMRHKLGAAEDALTRSEAQAKAKAKAQDDALQDAMNERTQSMGKLHMTLAQAEERSAQLEAEIRRLEVGAIRMREEEVRRVAEIEETLVDSIRSQLVNVRAQLASSGPGET